MAKNDKPMYVHKEISLLGGDLQSEKVSITVNDMLAQGYTVKVIEHEPKMDRDIGIVFITTIMATLTDLVDISN